MTTRCIAPGTGRFRYSGESTAYLIFTYGPPDAAAVVAIETLAVLSGSVDAKILEEATSWAAEHRVELMAEWRRLNPEKPQ